jgi:hypothetical protein
MLNFADDDARSRRAIMDLGLLITWRCAATPDDMVRILAHEFRTDLSDLAASLEAIIAAIPDYQLAEPAGLET